jgi:hypothetical protein
MSRTPARVTQADVARTIRAAKQAGAEGVEVRPDGTIYVRLAQKSAADNEKTPVDESGEVIL